jgi:hypothetical protein
MRHSILIPAQGLRRLTDRVRVWVTPRRPAPGMVWARELAPTGDPARERGYRERLRSPEARNLIRTLARLSVEKPLELLCRCGRAGACPVRLAAERIRACRRGGDFRLRWVGKDALREGLWNRQ